MSRMADYLIEKQSEAINYLASFGIDKEALWDVTENSYYLAIGLAEMHQNDVDIEIIKRIITETNAGL